MGLFVAGVAVFYYSIAPIVIKFTQSLRVNPMMLEASVHELPAAASASLLEMTRVLGDIDFEALAYIRLPDQLPTVTGYLALWVNRRSGDIATWTCANTILFTDMMPSFTTRFDDGYDIVTRSWKKLGVFPRHAREEKLNFPQVHDLRQLYTIHRLRVQRSTHTACGRLVPQEQDAIELVRRDTSREYEWLVEAGYHWLDARAERYRPTLKGAYLMTWKLLPPVKQVRQWLTRRNAARVLREIGFSAT
jgi:hypothetical protein